MAKAKAKRPYSKADMRAVSDNPEWTEEDFARAKPFKDALPELAKTIARRKNALMTLQKQISRRKLRRRVGERVQVMLEGPSKDTELVWEARLKAWRRKSTGRST